MNELNDKEQSDTIGEIFKFQSLGLSQCRTLIIHVKNMLSYCDNYSIIADVLLIGRLFSSMKDR